MNAKRTFRGTIAVLLLSGSVGFGEPVGTQFVYQGRLRDAGVPASGEYDMRFALFAQGSGGSSVAGPLTFDGAGANPDPVVVSNGLFQVSLDFGSVFGGDARWLRVEVRLHGTGSYETLAPRQPLTPTPYAMHSLGDSWSSNGGHIHNNNSGNVGIGTAAPSDRLHVIGSVLASGSLRSASPSGEAEVFLGWGADSVGAEMARIRIGGNSDGAYNGLEIQAVANRSLLRITNAGDVGIGTSDPANRLSVIGSANISSRLGVGLSNPLAPLHVGGGGDVSPSGGGAIVVGGTDLTNVAIDSNEIMARNNGAVSTLYLNANGGDVVVGGSLEMGHQIVVSGGGSATCPAGTNVIGGGCRISGDAEVRGSYPSGNRWNCEAGDQSGFITLTSYAICARIK